MTKIDVVEVVIQVKEKYKKYWRDQNEHYWYDRLVEEMRELGGAIVGEHEHSPDHELTQIASICLNWLEMRLEMVPEEKAK